jgi:uncharacterized protein (DUF58 family)
LTATGWWILFAGTGLNVLGWWFGYPEVVGAGCACLAAILIGLLWVSRAPRLNVARELVPQRVTKGDPAHGQIKMTNQDRWATSSLEALDSFGRDGIDVPFPKIGPGQTKTVIYRLPTSRRGVFQVGPLKIIRGDPLGVMRLASGRGSQETFWVYPRVHPVAPLPSGRSRHLEGPTSDSAQGSLTFHALREYVPGDDLRLIHWASTARTGTLMVRQQVDTSLPNATVVLDTRRVSYRHEDDFELAVEATASVLAASADRGFPIRFLTTCGKGISGGAGRARTSLFLDFLCPIELSRSGSLVETANVLARERGGTALAYVTGATDLADAGIVGRMASRFDTVVQIICAAGASGSLPPLAHVTTLQCSDSREFVESWNTIVRR